MARKAPLVVLCLVIVAVAAVVITLVRPAWLLAVTDGGRPKVERPWVGLATNPSAVNGAGDHNVLFRVADGELYEEAELSPVYHPALSRVEGGFAVAEADRVLFFDENFHQVDSEEAEDVSLALQSTAVGSANGKHAVWSFNIATPYLDKRAVIILNGMEARQLVRDKRLLGSRSCEDGSAVWLEGEPGEPTMTLVQVSANGDIEENAFYVPQGATLMDQAVYLACGTETSYLPFRDGKGGKGGIKLFSLAEVDVSTDFTVTLELVDEGEMGYLPSSLLSRASIAQDGTVMLLNDAGALSVIDYDKREVEDSAELIPASESAVGVTFDGQDFYVVTQAVDGDQSFYIHSFELANPQPSERGEKLGALAELGADRESQDGAQEADEADEESLGPVGHQPSSFYPLKK